MTQIQKQNYCYLSSLVCVCEGKETLAGQRERNGQAELELGVSSTRARPWGSPALVALTPPKRCWFYAKGVCPSLGQSHRGPAAPELGNGSSCSPRECPAAAVGKCSAGILLQCPGCSGLAQVSSTAKVNVPWGKILLSRILLCSVQAPPWMEEQVRGSGVVWAVPMGQGGSVGSQAGSPAGCGRSAEQQQQLCGNHWVGMGGCSLLTASRAPREAALPAWQSCCSMGSPRGCSPCRCLFVPCPSLGGHAASKK